MDSVFRQNQQTYAVLDHLAAADGPSDCRNLHGFVPCADGADAGLEVYSVRVGGPYQVLFTFRFGRASILDWCKDDTFTSPAATRRNNEEEAMSTQDEANAVGPRRPTLPGKILKEHFLKPSGRSVTDCAAELGLSRKHLSRLINGHHRMEPEVAAKLARLFGTSTKFWLNLQATVDAHDAERALGEWRPGK